VLVLIRYPSESEVIVWLLIGRLRSNMFDNCSRGLVVSIKFWKVASWLFGVVTILLLALNIIYFAEYNMGNIALSVVELQDLRSLVGYVQRIGLGIFTAIITGICLYQYNTVVKISEMKRSSLEFSPADEAMIRVLLKDGDE